MRRLTMGLAAAVMLLALAPSDALASDHQSRHLSQVEHARVEHFSGGVLTIRLRNGSILSGRVNRTTELECTAPQRMQITHDGDQSANDGPGNGMDANDNNEAQEQPQNEAREPAKNERADKEVREAARPRI